MSCIDKINKNIYSDPSEAIRVEGGTDINVTERDEFGVKIFTVNYSPYKEPAIDTQINPGKAEVGTIVPQADILVLVSRGSEDIQSVVTDPNDHLFNQDPNGDYTASWSESNVTAFKEGLHPLFDGDPTRVNVRDRIKVTYKDIGVHFYYPLFSLLSDQETMADFPVSGKIIDKDFFENNNVMEFTSDEPKYIYWIQAIVPGKKEIVRVTDNDLPVPTIRLADIVKSYAGGTVRFSVLRTALKATYDHTKLKLLENV